MDKFFPNKTFFVCPQIYLYPFYFPESISCTHGGVECKESGLICDYSTRTCIGNSLDAPPLVPGPDLGPVPDPVPGQVSGKFF